MRLTKACPCRSKSPCAAKTTCRNRAWAQALQQLAKPAGFDIQLDLTDPDKYWDRWTEVNLGITHWGHRTMSTICLRLAYTKKAIGKWNETHWVDEEFEQLLDKAEMTLDVPR